MTNGEQRVLLALVVVAVYGAGISFVVVNQLGGGKEILRPLTGYDIWSIVAGAIGAAAGLFASRNWFGHPGIAGVSRAALGVVMVSFVGSIIGGTIALPLYGTMFGPFSLVVTLFGAPLLAVFWACILMSAHLLIAVWRRERETIFVF